MGYILLIVGVVLLLWLVMPFAVWIVKMGIISAVALAAIYFGVKLIAGKETN